MSFDEDFFAKADAEFDAAPIKTGKSEYAREQHTCEACNGSGLWRAGRQNYRGNAKCNACNGLGYFVTSKADRMKARAQRAARKQAAAQSAAEAAQEQNAASGLLEALSDMASWNDFARSMVQQSAAGRVWSERQVAAAQRMVDKVAAKRADQDAKRVNVDLSGIIEMFEAAFASGYKRPAYRAEGLRIKPGRGGALLVLNEDRMEDGYYGMQPGYEGKIEQGAFAPGRQCASDTSEKLIAISSDPLNAAIRYGQRTGRCSCCGRELTKHASIEAGIGPICAQKWGL